MVHSTQAVILAGGKSTRFNTGRTKLAEKICGQELILYATKLFESLSLATTVVVGYQDELIRSIITKHHQTVQFAKQVAQLGSWDALACSHDLWNHENILIMNGDMPLVTKDIITQLITTHHEQNADVSFVIAHYNEPSSSYGRIVTKDGIVSIVEAKEFTQDPHEYCCINAGIYLVKKEFLLSQMNAITRNELSNEFYLTDLIKNASLSGKKVVTVTAPFDRIRGINTLEELWACEQIKRSELIKYWMNNGVRFSGAQNSHIDVSVTIGAGTVIECGVHLRGTTTIGCAAYIGEFSSIENSILQDTVTVYSHSVIKESFLESGSCVGPFAHLRDHTTIKSNAEIGNFVEVKNSTIGTKSKAKHLSYLGDATVGNEVNIGAGTITANYDGVQKHKTIINDGAYIGCNTSIIAPVTVGADSLVAAGSVITDNVPDHALAIARSRQTIKEGRGKSFYTNKKKITSTSSHFSL